MTIEKQHEIIKILKEIDGESMQYILQKSGHEYQMGHQLIMTLPLEFINCEISERFELEKSLRK